MKKLKTKVFAIVLCLAMVLTLMPVLTFAESGSLPASGEIQLTEGDVTAGFVPAGTVAVSEDPSVAWIDAQGNLKALKAGATSILVETEDNEKAQYDVTVAGYSDGSEVVGKLKILARYNDSMAFYDGHVYLLFTSYQDDVQVGVNDLYGAYDISDQYYSDINADIANGSNHTGNDTSPYFNFVDTKGSYSTTLDRGDIVTIGMYRGFDLSVEQAAIGCIMNSSGWKELVAAGKTGVMETIFAIFAEKGGISPEEAFAKLKEVCDEIGMDYTKLLDGVVEGGVCFNRELYNQKLEWDQFENVTYELDITQNQLDSLMMSLNGNLDIFSPLKNSCATVALRAWNSAVGTRDGVPTAYYLTAEGKGIYTIMDAPKGVRDNIVDNLPGYYLNNSYGVEEPNAGFEDETGWVYVSAPEKVESTAFTYSEAGPVVIDESRNSLQSLYTDAKAGTKVTYGEESPQVGVSVKTEAAGEAIKVTGLDFTVNEQIFSLAAENGIWFKAQVGELKEDTVWYVTDADGNALPSEYADGWISFYTESLPVTYKIEGSTEGTKNILKTQIINNDKAKADLAIYSKSGDLNVPISETAELKSGTKIYVRSRANDLDLVYVLKDISMNGKSFMDKEHFDADEGAYVIEMPEKYSTLQVAYETAFTKRKVKTDTIQVFKGDILNVSDYVELFVGNNGATSDKIRWLLVSPDEEHAEYVDADQKQLRAVNEGMTVIYAEAENNPGIGEVFFFEVFDNPNEVAKVTFSDETAANADIVVDDIIDIESGSFVKKGSVLEVIPKQSKTGYVISKFTANRKEIAPGERTVTVTKDTEIKVELKKAEINGVTDLVSLNKKGDTYKLNAKVKYSGLVSSLLPVYDPAIIYTSSDPLVEVDENGLIKVVGNVPEEGTCVIITAAARSGIGVERQCKVSIGNYAGSKIVGKLTISARHVTQDEKVGHGCLTFTTYEDVDLATSYHTLYEPNEKYYALMADYEDHPEKYPSDPALFSEEIPIENRESYFNIDETSGAFAEPRTIHLMSGASMTVSNYGFGGSQLETFMQSIKGSTLSEITPAAQYLVTQIEAYLRGEEFDGPLTFDSAVRALALMFGFSWFTGENPADGLTPGGLCVNREMFNEFRRNDSQFPNNYHQIEITADELAQFKAYLSNPQNNFYNLFSMNCASGVRNAWNQTLADRPDLRLKANYSGITDDTESLYYELGLLNLKKGLPGQGGTQFYPKSVPSRHKWGVVAEDNVITAICTNKGIEHHLGNCEYAQVENGYKLTVSADACDPQHVTLDGLEVFNAATGKDVAATSENTKFFRVKNPGAVKDGVEVPEGTDINGFYYVEFTLDDVVARAPFTIGEVGDYSAVLAILEKVPEDLSLYTESSVKVLNTVIDAIAWDLGPADQDEIDAMAKAIEVAINNLVWKQIPVTPVLKLNWTTSTYNGKVKKPGAKVYVNDEELDPSEYELQYDNGRKNAGTYNVVVTLTGKYSGIAYASFTIKPAKVAPVVKLPYSSYSYNGKTKKPTPTVYVDGKVVDASNYTVKYDAGRKEIGTYKVTVTMKGNYQGSGSASFKIVQKQAVPVVTLPYKSYTYNGKVKTPKPKVSVDGVVLDSSQYDVVYDPGRKEIGVYYVTVILKGNYYGAGSKSFTICPKNTSLTSVSAVSKGFTVKWKKQTDHTTGYQISFSTDKNFKKNINSVTVAKNTQTSRKITGLKSKTTYYVRIRTYKKIGSKSYYSNTWSSVKAVKTK